MQVIINNKICDNSPACGGVVACPTGALYWCETDNKIAFDESKCTGCGACVSACPVRAIMLARDSAAAKKINADIAADPRTVADLFCDRYGSDICDTQSMEPSVALDDAKKIAGLVVLELYDEETLHCLVTSIPMTEIFGHSGWTHFKTQADETVMKNTGVSELPALVVFRDGIKIGTVQGYFEDNTAEKGLLLKKVNEIIKK